MTSPLSLNKLIKTLKLLMTCDSDTYYCLNAIPYLGKGSTNLAINKIGLGQHFTTELVAPFKCAGRIVTSDNWFTSLPLARALRKDKMHLVGTIRPKPYIPTQLVKTLKVGQSCALYNHGDKVTLLAQKVKTTKKYIFYQLSTTNQP